MPASIALKAELLSLVLAAFPTDKGLNQNPFSAHTAAETDWNAARREYYVLLLHEAAVWLDENGVVCLDVSADPEDSQYLTWLLHGGEQALFRSWTPVSSTVH